MDSRPAAGGAGVGRRRWLVRYRALAVLGLNTAAAFVALNLAAWLVLALMDWTVPAVNVVEDKYGTEALTAAYPGMTTADVRQLLDETWLMQRAFRPYVHFREVPFTGRFVNVHEAGFRHSADQAPWPPDGRFAIVFLGGSTTFAYGLPDADTVPSQVQRVLHERDYRDVAVYNFGAGAYQSTQERIYFGELLATGARPDLVILIDGLNEFAFNEVPQGTELMAQALQGNHGALAGVLRGLAALPLTQLARRSLPAPPAADVASADGDAAAAEARVERAVTRYLSNIRQIGAVARDAGIAPVFVWQPIPYYRYDIRHHPFADRGGVNRDAFAGYTRMRRHVDGAPIDAAFLWAADIQDGIAESLYVDAVHYNRAMSERLATWIADRLVERRLVPRRP